MNRNKVVLAVVLVTLMIAAGSRETNATIISHAIPVDSAPTSVLFDPGLGTLTSVSLEFKFRSSVIYDIASEPGILGSMLPFDVSFAGLAPFAIDNTGGSRSRTFSWTQPGHSEGGHANSYYTAQNTDSFFWTYTDQDVLDFFTVQGGDLGLFYEPGWSEWIGCSPETVFDDNGNRYDALFASVGIGDGIVITYDYEDVAAIPEPSTLILLGAGAIPFLSLLRRAHRNVMSGHGNMI